MRLAWREYQDARAYAGIFDGVHDTPHPPTWFVVGELAFGAAAAPPSLLATMIALREWCFGLHDSPRPQTHDAVAAGESTLSLVVEVGWRIELIMLTHGLRSAP